MNCRIPRIIESLNASCARGLTEGISARASPRHPPNTHSYVMCVRVKVAIRMGPRPSLGAGRLGWLKCREFGRRGRTTSDQVIRVQTRNSNVRRLRHPVGSELQSRSPLPSAPPSEGERGKTSRIRPLIRKDYPLSLSISLSGGEETNQDFPSNGERTGKSPA